MIVFLSYVIAFFLTLALAILLYPVAALFWAFGIFGKILVAVFNLFGKISDGMFRFTTKVIRHLWKDIRNIEKQPIPTVLADTWVCVCGTVNTGNFCSECGGPKVVESEPKILPEAEVVIVSETENTETPIE